MHSEYIIGFIIFIDRIIIILSVRGCITFFTEPKNEKTKACLCTKYSTKFTRIPQKLPDFVAVLTIENQHIDFIDSTQLIGLPHLINLTVSNNNVTKVVPDSFVHIPQIKMLRLSRNRLYLRDSSFPRSSLVYLNHLEILDLSQNPLGLVPDYFFQSLKKLKVLILSGASKGFFVEDNGFYGLTELRLLDLSFNHLITLSEGLSPTLSEMQLQELYLYNNTWTCDCNLQWLKMWFTKFKDVKYSREHFQSSTRSAVEYQPMCESPQSVSGKKIFSNSIESESIKITDFKCLPKIFTNNRDIEVVKGENVTLTCEFHANPGGSVSWSKNGMIVQKHWQKVTSGQTQGIRFKAWLHIVRADQNDNGNWKCMLMTGVGKVNATFAIRVSSPNSKIDFKTILKYVGIGAVTLILLLVVVGIIIYCVYGFQLQGNRRSDKSRNTNKLSKTDLTAKQPVNHYRIISKPDEDLNIESRILVAPIEDGGQYFNPVIMGTTPSVIQPCLEQSPHSPFSHYLVNGSSAVCPLHGDLVKSNSVTKPSKDVTDHSNTLVKLSAADPLSGPCPIHGDVLSYLSPPSSSASSTSVPIIPPKLDLLHKTGSPANEYVLRVSSSNPVVVVTANSSPINATCLSSANSSYSYSAAI